MSVSIFTVTSKSAVLRWSRYEGALSYRVTASLRNSPVSVVFANFGQNTIMGSVNSLNPNTAYTFHVEALGSLMNVLADANVDGSTGTYWKLAMSCSRVVICHSVKNFKWFQNWKKFQWPFFGLKIPHNSRFSMVIETLSSLSYISGLVSCLINRSCCSLTFLNQFGSI